MQAEPNSAHHMLLPLLLLLLPPPPLPSVLQAHMLSQELLTLPQGPAPANVASLAAQTHSRRSVLGPLLCVASSGDVLAVLRAGSGFFQGSGSAAGGYAPSGGAKVRDGTGQGLVCLTGVVFPAVAGQQVCCWMFEETVRRLWRLWRLCSKWRGKGEGGLRAGPGVLNRCHFRLLWCLRKQGLGSAVACAAVCGSSGVTILAVANLMQQVCWWWCLRWRWACAAVCGECSRCAGGAASRQRFLKSTRVGVEDAVDKWMFQRCTV
jgi:hypothetical protein